MNINDIINGYNGKIIGIIGATAPTEEYSSFKTYELGKKVRELAEKKDIIIFTGGVDGVGLDIYSGIVAYCDSEKIKDDKFFIILPENFEPSEGYYFLADSLKTELNIMHLGKNMTERREYISQIADYLVVINGSKGTLHEAINGMNAGKQIVCLKGSGGVADFLINIAEGKNAEYKFTEDQKQKPIIFFDDINKIITYLDNSIV